MAWVVEVMVIAAEASGRMERSNDGGVGEGDSEAARRWSC